MTTRSSKPAFGARSGLAGLAVVALASAACSPSSTASPSLTTTPGTARPSTIVSTPISSLPPSLSASPSPSASGVATQCTTIASGLLNPRGIAVTSDGTIYVAEAGTGGTEADFPTSPAGSPAASSAATAEASATAIGSPTPVTTHGETGQVTKITPDGQQSVVVSGLTSYNFMGEVVGPADVVVGKDGTLYVSIGGPGPGTAQVVPAGNADSVVSVDSSGTVTELANIGQYERENNPDPNAIDSNVGGMAMGSDGLLYVADSGGNDLYSVDPSSGELKVVAVFAGLPSAGGALNPARGNKPEVDPVPTDVTADPKGGVYVGFLTGAALWASSGSAKVVHVGVDGKVDDAVTGLNMVTGVSLKDDSIIASELSTNFTTTPPAAGEIISAASGGTPQTVLTDIPLPYGVAVAPDGTSIDIVVNATGESGTAPNGQVINCPLPAVPGSSPGTSPAASATAPVSTAPSSALPTSSAKASTPASIGPSALPTESAPPASSSPTAEASPTSS